MCNILSCVPVFLNYSPLVETDEIIYNNTLPEVQILIAVFRPSKLPPPTHRQSIKCENGIDKLVTCFVVVTFSSLNQCTKGHMAPF